ncbi:myosin-11-like [Pseudorasbora parva]|uniref:myosin-11-like n=1 Tax=Pseudorasbora parva TaxID=51549 RepID=UPI00351E7188
MAEAKEVSETNQAKDISLEVPNGTVSANFGEDVTLPVHLSPETSAVSMNIRWFRESELIYQYNNGQEKTNDNYEQRLSLSIQELERGNLSLTFRDVQESDSGKYTCKVFPDGCQTGVVHLEVRGVRQMFRELKEMKRAIMGSEREMEMERWIEEMKIQTKEPDPEMEKKMEKMEELKRIKEEVDINFEKVEEEIKHIMENEKKLEELKIKKEEIKKKTKESEIKLKETERNLEKSERDVEETKRKMHEIQQDMNEMVLDFNRKQAERQKATKERELKWQMEQLEHERTLKEIVENKNKMMRELNEAEQLYKKDLEEIKIKLSSMTDDEIEAYVNSILEEDNETIDTVEGESGDQNTRPTEEERTDTEQETPAADFSFVVSVSANFGEDVTLPVHLSPETSAVSMNICWFRESELIYQYNNGQEKTNDNYEQRLSLSIQELERGNLSLTLRNVQESDSGKYTCKVIHDGRVKTLIVHLQVRVQRQIMEQQRKRKKLELERQIKNLELEKQKITLKMEKQIMELTMERHTMEMEDLEKQIQELSLPTHALHGPTPKRTRSIDGIPPLMSYDTPESPEKEEEKDTSDTMEGGSGDQNTRPTEDRTVIERETPGTSSQVLQRTSESAISSTRATHTHENPEETVQSTQERRQESDATEQERSSTDI